MKNYEQELRLKILKRTSSLLCLWFGYFAPVKVLIAIYTNHSHSSSMLTVSNEISLNTESKQSDSSSSQNEHPLSFEKITSSNLSQFRQQNSVLFPILYPESFYRNIINSKEVSAYLGNEMSVFILYYLILYYFYHDCVCVVYYNDTCIGSYSTRLEPISRWKEISSGRMIDNFNPVSETENSKNNRQLRVFVIVDPFPFF